MKKLNVLTAFVLAGLLMAGCSQKDTIVPTDDESLSLKNASIAGKYIVVLKEDVGIAKSDLQTRNFKVKEKAQGLLKKYEVSGEIEEVFETALQGFTVKMAPGQVKKMEIDPEVGYIEVDKIIALSPIEISGKPGGGGTTQPNQTTPWGITRVGGGTNSSTHTAWIIDTGVDFTHPDLNVDTGRSKTFVSRTSSANDDNGHGSHVAGTIAAKNNSIGVVGVAPGNIVVAVKVLDSRGSGTTSGVINGINYVAVNGHVGDVANMSLGGGVSTSLDAAVLNASSKGIFFALAAGNESDDANNHSPARVNGTYIYTVSAMDSNDKWAYFSNFGNPPVDYCAPGVSVYSCYKGGGYATLNGTSMATPHVAGLLLFGVNSDGKLNKSGNVIGDPDSSPDPIAYK